MSSARLEERRPVGSTVQHTERRSPLDIAMQRIDELEARLDDEKKRNKRTTKAVQQVYDRGGIVRRTDKTGYTKTTTFTGDPDKDKIHVDSLRGRFVAHVTRHI